MSANSALLDTDGVTKRFGGLTAVDNVDFTLDMGHTKSLIGPNGAGKTTLINCLTGALDVTSGRIRFKGEEITDNSPDERARAGVGRTYQITNLFDEFTVMENARLAAQIDQGPNRKVGAHYASLVGPRETALTVLEQVGLDDRLERTVSSLSHGEKRQLELAVAMATDPDLLLLDEPTAGMSKENSVIIQNLISDLKDEYAILLVEHNLDVVMEVSDSIMVLHQGAIIADGVPEEVREDERVRDAYMGT
jgi:branched-chain amino acid transport system ATP-binding protein